MNCPRLFFACVILIMSPLVAVAGPGDPRLVNGVLEWPRAVTNEPFVIVRGDDGVLYYIGVAAARRDGAVTAGARVSVLGIEGRSAHEITAVGFGSGATPEAALAQLQGGARPPATPPVPSAPVAVAALPAPVAPASAPVSTPAAPVAPSPVPVAAPSTPVMAPPAPMAAPPAPVAAAPTPVAPQPAVVPASTAAAAPAPPAIAATAPMLPVDDRRWTELTGEVETLVGRTLVLKVDGGRVIVDVSSLSANLERMVAPGSKVKVYGVPVELRFKAMGFIDPDARGRSR